MSTRYTAAEIASALGWSKARVTAALQLVSPCGVKIVYGNEARSWMAGAFPEVLQREMERLLVIHRFRSVDELLQNPTQPWRPAIGIGQACQPDIRRAEQLRDALARALQASEECSISERARIASADYQREFGRAISDRHLRTLITRTMDRDRGARAFDRLEIYLPESPRRQARLLVTTQFPELADDFATIADRVCLTSTQRSFCWRKIIASYSAEIASGQPAKAVKRALCEFAFAEVPGLAKTASAVQRNFERKLIEAAQSGVEALIDRRAGKSGRLANPAVWSNELKKLKGYALGQTSARISQAYRELHEGTAVNGERFSEEFRAAHPFDVRRAKSDVPKNVRAEARASVLTMESRHRGPKASRLSGPSYRRDWSEVYAGDSYSADDVTCNSGFIDWCEDGEFIFEGQRFNLTRGQTLLFCDERSQRVHGFYLTPRPNYGASTICAGINRICMDPAIGLPFRRFLFERGSWKSRAVSSAVDWSRIDDLFIREGVSFLPKIVHATTPKAKIIERVIRAIQDRMDGLPGYVGRNQRLNGPERTAAAMAQLRRFDQRLKADIDPRKNFLTKEQFCAALEDAARRFNAEPQNGKMLPGISPEEGWEKLHEPNGPAHKVLPESIRYLLSTQVAEVTVSDEGIALVRRGQPPRYYSGHARLGQLLGEKVRVRFDPEMPEVILVCHLRTDPKELRPFAVDIDPSIPAIGATAADFNNVRATRKLFRKFGADEYRILRPRFNLTVLNEKMGSDDVRRTGEAMIAEKRGHEALNVARHKQGRRAAEIAKRHGLRVEPSKLRRPERALELAAKMQETEARIRLREAEESQ